MLTVLLHQSWYAPLLLSVEGHPDILLDMVFRNMGFE